MIYELIRKQLSSSVPFAKHVAVELDTIEKAAPLCTCRPVAAEAAIRYFAVAKGPVRAEVSVSDDADALLHSVRTDGNTVFRVFVSMTGEDQTRVAEMTVDWHVSMKRK
jgi:hypothetical protein